ncbi:MAG: hypothetical protein HYU84_00965 [Chloroflexi bacterium]|nr:hypothetical protein [Chloroflexota bacterium]MBI3170072.1 hypothetical protein [Chloroflexota bacterium]
MKIIKLLQKNSTGKNVAILFSMNMVFYVTILFYSIPMVLQSAPDMKLFDVSPSGYTREYAISLLNAIGPEGRNLYLSLQLPLDFVYPGLFIISYPLLLAWLLKKNHDLQSKVYYALYLPILAGLFDYVENVLVILMLKTYPDLDLNLVATASFATITKSVLSSVFFTLLILSILQVVWKSVIRSLAKANRKSGF